MSAIKNKAERLAKIAEHYAKDGGYVTLVECGVCGAVEWYSTDKSRPSGVFAVRPLDGHQPCASCNEAFHRSPELVAWVMGVVNKTLEDLALPAKKNGDTQEFVYPPKPFSVNSDA